jgi:hypothetical protein
LRVQVLTGFIIGQETGDETGATLSAKGHQQALTRILP